MHLTNDLRFIYIMHLMAGKKNQASHSFYVPRIHDDDRRKGTFDVFATPKGDINYSFIYPGAIAAWHRHKKQTDFWQTPRELNFCT